MSVKKLHHSLFNMFNCSLFNFWQGGAEIIKEVSAEIKGGGGGQPTFATACGVNPDGLKTAV
ncbi:MAG: hypothetical protein IH948_10005 [Bacteroidetes bacterium]|nr:hypothetical protein [Bacteroidota bacterium]